MRMNSTTQIIAILALLSFSAPAFAKDHDDYHHNNSRNNKSEKHYRKAVKRQQKTMAKWEWDRHNWGEQREYMRSNWSARRARINAAQRAQLDNQLRSQWLAYHHNRWNGGYSWNQYSDPAFLDYIQTQNPSLLSSLRNALGF